MVARACPAPLEDAAAHLSHSIASRLSTKLDDPGLVTRTVTIVMSWLLAGEGRVHFDRAKRFRLEPSVDRVLRQLGRSMVWMANHRYHHGQQASQAAAKTLRAVRTGRVDMDGLLGMAARFRALRQAHVRRTVHSRAYAPNETLLLADSTMQATRVVSVRDLNRLGQEGGNCLARPGYRKHYAEQLKRKQTAFWRIDPVGTEARPDRRPSWVIAIDQATNELQELEHTGPAIVMPRDRDALLEFLVQRDVGPGEDVEAELARFLISPVLIRSLQAGAVRHRTARMGGARWVFEIGAPGVLVALPYEGEAHLEGHESALRGLLLHGATTRSRSVLSVWSAPTASATQSDDSDEPDEEVDDEEVAFPEPDAGLRYMRDLAVRLALQQACARNAPLRAACLVAFAGESPLFLTDWFGTATGASLYGQASRTSLCRSAQASRPLAGRKLPLNRGRC